MPAAGAITVVRTLEIHGSYSLMMALILQVDSEQTLPTVFGDMGIGHLTQCANHAAVLGFVWACT
jgi:hypothetical protein